MEPKFYAAVDAQRTINKLATDNKELVKIAKELSEDNDELCTEIRALNTNYAELEEKYELLKEDYADLEQDFVDLENFVDEQANIEDECYGCCCEDCFIVPQISQIYYCDEPGKAKTIVIFNDGTKVIKDVMPGDTFDLNIGVSLCIAERIFGTKSAFHKYVKRVEKYSKRK